MAEEVIVIDLNEKTDLMSVRTKCPTCGHEYLYGVPYVTVPCSKCGISYRTDFKQDIYTKKARFIEDKKTERNEIIFKATEAYKSALIHIRYNHMEQKCWDVSEIEEQKEEFKHCYKCGVCLNCFFCKDCNTHFKRNQNRRKQECPNCHSTNLTRTYFKDAKESKSKESMKIRLCPECGSEHIKLTLTKNKSKCHLCGSKTLSPTKVNCIYVLTVKRKGAYYKTIEKKE